MDIVRSFESSDTRLGSAGPLLVALYRGSTFPTIADGLAWVQALPGQDLSIKTGLNAVDVEPFLA